MSVAARVVARLVVGSAVLALLAWSVGGLLGIAMLGFRFVTGG